MRAVPVVLAATVLLAALPTASAETTVDELRKAEQQCNRGARYLILGNYGRAERWFARSLQTVAAYPEAHVGIGHIAMAERRFADALESYSKAIEGYRKLGHMMIDRRARAFRDAQIEIAKFQRAIADVERLAAMYRITPGQMYERIREYRQAIEALESVEPPDSDADGEAPGVAHFFLGNAFYRLGRLDDAVREWNTCMELSPRFPYAFNNLAIAYWKLGRTDDALRFLDRAESLGMSVNPAFRRDLELASRPSEQVIL